MVGKRSFSAVLSDQARTMKERRLSYLLGNAIDVIGYIIVVSKS